MRIRNRQFIYVHGYDPRGLAYYHRLFCTELGKFGALYKLATIHSPLQVTTDDAIGSWTAETDAGEWRTRTCYDFLRFEDLIRRDLALPAWRTVLYSVWVYLRWFFGGTIAKVFRASWRFAGFMTYPYFVLLIEALCAFGIALAVATGLEAWAISRIASIAVAIALFIVVFGGFLKRTEHITYMLYLQSFIIWSWQFSHRRRSDWDQLIDRFAEHVVDVTRRGEAEEIIVAGHSAGSFIATEIVARALKLDPDLGRRGPRVALLTLGGSLPVIGFLSVSQDFRDHLRLLAVERSIDWIDCQARKDVMNFYRFDPIAGHGIDVGTARRNPTLMKVRFGRIIKPEHYKRFRWRFFRVHFQFVMANEIPNPYDFFMIVCGPILLSERVGHGIGARVPDQSGPRALNA